ncbi:hypothetical protein K227x_31600 [Rubripirellula lacrimiformis]|uniref:DUF883 domain-containing protein n=1 Tax=Rubripirellula lacrimiformis TaxID=1930273 RepID=A0A517NC97_9BACT|nr:hypothetical protein [Rubripirellula lacrimiformis]QDT04764.1 hypothetical protein K227x_31600 [Rubripirellula lacrimiformis]
MTIKTKQANPSSPNYRHVERREHTVEATEVAAEKLQAYGSHFVAEPARDLGSQLRDYARRKPDVAVMWCFGLGIIVGWKLRG